MIKISKITDYAIVVLASLAVARGEVLTATSISRSTQLPEPTVSKVLKLLSKGSVISSVRGAAGGYRMERSATSISMREIITALDGPIAVTTCADPSGGDDCQIQGVCPMKRGWQKLNFAVASAFDTVSLADMIDVNCCRKAG
ncbi:MAG: SUF system Fe-S cluster assembly regulator [Pseudobdellovibrionaceae bacterium]